MTLVDNNKTMMLYLRYLGVVLLLPLLVACSEDEDGGDDGPDGPEPPTTTEACADVIAAQTVTAYEVDGKSQDLQNVKVAFKNDETYELLLPGVDIFGSKGTWKANDDCSELTLTDEAGETLTVKVDTDTPGQVIISFGLKNFKEDTVPFEIVLAPPSS